MLDYLEGKRGGSIWNKCIFGAFEVPVEIYFRDWNSFPSIESFALSLSNGKVLDIGAGSGCHTLALQQEGIDVTALEISALNVEVMDRRGVNRVIQADVFEVQAGEYDTLVMLMNGIGLVGDLAGLERFLNHAHNLVSQDGKIIFDSTDLLVDHPKAREINKSKQYHGTVTYRMIYEDMVGQAFDWLFVDEKTLKRICKRTGWSMQKIFEDDDGHYLVQLKRSSLNTYP